MDAIVSMVTVVIKKHRLRKTFYEYGEEVKDRVLETRCAREGRTLFLMELVIISEAMSGLPK